MKLKEHTYTALYLSDIHYLIDHKIRNHNHKDLFRLLNYFYKRKIRFKRIVLVGDILESWYFSADKKLKNSKKRFDKLFDRFDRLATPKGVKIFVVGNHDTVSFRQKLASRIEDYLEDRNWEITEKYESRAIVAMHGHQGQYNKFNWAFDIAIVRLLFNLARLFPRFFQYAENFYNQHLNRKDPVTKEEKLKYYSKLSSIAEQGNRVLITGHTHDFLAMPELKIINTGDWIQNRSFVMQKKTRFFGLQLDKNLRIVTRFTIHF